jgi:molybdopterin-guanine dinucleotide biosynthesis protein A
MNFSAVILAGGKSSRMGRDKAFVEVGGQTLLARQILIVRQAGASEVLISGRAGVDYSVFDCRVIEDKFQEAGPLAGIERALNIAANSLLLVLAVDMADMSGDFLKNFSAHGQDGLGAVPVVNGIIEPLAAFYPKATAGLIQKILAESSPARVPGAKHFAEQCLQKGFSRFIPVPPAASGFFKSWNSPTDLPPTA